MAERNSPPSEAELRSLLEDIEESNRGLREALEALKKRAEYNVGASQSGHVNPSSLAAFNQLPPIPSYSRRPHSRLPWRFLYRPSEAEVHVSNRVSDEEDMKCQPRSRSPISIRYFDPAPRTGQDLMAMFPPTSGYLQQQERAFFSGFVSPSPDIDAPLDDAPEGSVKARVGMEPAASRARARPTSVHPSQAAPAPAPPTPYASHPNTFTLHAASATSPIPEPCPFLNPPLPCHCSPGPHTPPQLVTDEELNTLFERAIRERHHRDALEDASHLPEGDRSGQSRHQLAVEAIPTAPLREEVESTGIPSRNPRPDLVSPMMATNWPFPGTVVTPFLYPPPLVYREPLGPISAPAVENISRALVAVPRRTTQHAIHPRMQRGRWTSPNVLLALFTAIATLIGLVIAGVSLRFAIYTAASPSPTARDRVADV